MGFFRSSPFVRYSKCCLSIDLLNALFSFVECRVGKATSLKELDKKEGW